MLFLLRQTVLLAAFSAGVLPPFIRLFFFLRVAGCWFYFAFCVYVCVCELKCVWREADIGIYLLLASWLLPPPLRLLACALMMTWFSP